MFIRPLTINKEEVASYNALTVKFVSQEQNYEKKFIGHYDEKFRAHFKMCHLYGFASCRIVSISKRHQG